MYLVFEACLLNAISQMYLKFLLHALW